MKYSAVIRSRGLTLPSGTRAVPSPPRPAAALLHRQAVQRRPHALDEHVVRRLEIDPDHRELEVIGDRAARPLSSRGSLLHGMIAAATCPGAAS